MYIISELVQCTGGAVHYRGLGILSVYYSVSLYTVSVLQCTLVYYQCTTVYPCILSVYYSEPLYTVSVLQVHLYNISVLKCFFQCPLVTRSVYAQCLAFKAKEKNM